MMRIEHRGRRPTVDPSAYIAPTAVLSGDVRVGPDSRVLFGAVLTAEGGSLEVGARCIVMEHAVLRASPRHRLTVGDHVLIGPHAHLTGCTVASDVFIATGASVFNGARVGPRAEVRINGVVHANTELPAGATVPIGWIAVGAPARLHSPDQHDEIWSEQQRLDFPGTVFGLRRASTDETIMPELTARYGRALGAHRDDRVLDD